MNSVEISLAIHPYSLFCPVSLVVARALSEDAFSPSFDALDQLLHRPLFEDNINYISLQWKKELLDEEIFPIEYNRFWALLARTVEVAGYPESLRPYALRVGAGTRLNCKFYTLFRFVTVTESY